MHDYFHFTIFISLIVSHIVTIQNRLESIRSLSYRHKKMKNYFVKQHTTMQFCTENECYECIKDDVSDENPDSVNFPVDGFPPTERPRCRSTGNGEKTQREIRSFALSPVSRTLCAGNPTAMCTELLLIKGIVERLVEKPHREPTMQSMKLHLAVWTATRKGCVALAFPWR